jgi:hypothetical protein
MTKATGAETARISPSIISGVSSSDICGGTNTIFVPLLVRELIAAPKY